MGGASSPAVHPAGPACRTPGPSVKEAPGVQWGRLPRLPVGLDPSSSPQESLEGGSRKRRTGTVEQVLWGEGVDKTRCSVSDLPVTSRS